MATSHQYLSNIQCMPVNSPNIVFPLEWESPSLWGGKWQGIEWGGGDGVTEGLSEVVKGLETAVF